MLAVLSNAELQLSTLEKQAEVEQQLNNMRSQELALLNTRNANLRDLNQAETDLAKARRQYDLYKPLAEKGFVSSKTFNDARDDLDYQTNAAAHPAAEHRPERSAAERASCQLRAASSSLNSSMGVARDSLGQLNIRAPVTGQLSGFDIQLGQSLQQGERIGQIDSAGGDKLQADVDEFYLGRVAVGQTASADIDGKTYRLKVAKVYPQVRNGQFQIDLLFVGPEPPIDAARPDRAGEADARRCVESFAHPQRRLLQRHRRHLGVRRRQERQQRDQAPVQLGRRNSDFIEVLGGLKPGDRVITSSYSGLTDKDRLTFSSGD